MPTGVVLTSPSAATTASAGYSAATALSAPKRAHSGAGEIAGARGIRIDNSNLAGIEREQRMRDGHASPTRAELNDALASRIAKAAPKTFKESGPVGVMADAAAIFEHHRIDRTDLPRIGVEFVEMRHHRLLAGKGDVQSGKAGLLCFSEDFWQVRRREAEHIEIDQPVDIVQTLRSALLHVHARRQGSLNARADEANENRVGWHIAL